MRSSVAELLCASAGRYGDKVALIFEEERWSFQRLHEASSRLAAQLYRYGVGEGDVVSLYSPNCPQWIIAYYAVLKLGAVVNPLNLMFTAEEAAFAMQDCGAVAVVGSAAKIAGLEAVLPTTRLRHRITYGALPPAGALDFDELVGAGDPNWTIPPIDLESTSTIAYTSGTTGHPKGAVLTHRAILLNTAMTATLHVRTAADVVVSALPCSHVYGNIVMNAAIAYGMTLVLHAAFDSATILSSIELYRATIFEGVPTMYLYLLEAPQLSSTNLSSLRCCTVGGQTMPVAKMQLVIERFGCPLIELWGMTELGGLGTTHCVYGPARIGSIGIALPHVEIRVANSEDPTQRCTIDEMGELQVRGPIVMREYFNRPEETAQVRTEDGWLRTGDLARVDSQGYFYVVDRLKDMIITAGFNIYPAEIERVIAEHPDVAMVAVGSVPDDHKGELAKAYVVRRAGSMLEVDALLQHCRERLAAYKVPRACQFVADVPKTSNGKILRRMLHTLDSKASTGGVDLMG